MISYTMAAAETLFTGNEVLMHDDDTANPRPNDRLPWTDGDCRHPKQCYGCPCHRRF
jgi:hypothetical protein